MWLHESGRDKEGKITGKVHDEIEGWGGGNIDKWKVGIDTVKKIGRGEETGKK